MKKIMVVDDEKSLCVMLKRTLESTGRFSVLTESVSTNALAQAKEFQPDLIILDISMPEMDGSDVEEALKKEETTKTIPIIFLSAMASSLDPSGEGVTVDNRFLISKPVGADKLVEIVDKKLSE